MSIVTHTSNLKIYFKFLFSQPTLYLHVETDSCGPMAATVQLYNFIACLIRIENQVH